MRSQFRQFLDSRTRLPILAALLFLANYTSAQTTVVLAPIPIFSSYTQYGVPNAFGCVFSFVSGTTQPLATFSDYTGNTQNANPVVLSAGGTASIWLQVGTVYTLQIKTAGGINCASGSTLATVNGIGGGAVTQTTIVPYSPTPAFPVTSQNQLFTLTLTGNAVALPISVTGVSAPSYITFQITQDATGGRTFTWPSNIVGGAPIGSAAGQITTQMFVWNGNTAIAIGPATVGAGNASFEGALLSPAITNPTINSYPMPYSPGAIIQSNSNSTGTSANTLTVLSPSGGVQTATTSTTGGILGVCMTGCGTSVSATFIQQSGEAFCVFDGSITVGDYIQESTTVAGDCHDAGSTLPGSGQVIGMASGSASGAGTYPIFLFGPEIQGGNTGLVYTASGTLLPHAHTVVTGTALPGSGPGTIVISGAASFSVEQFCTGTDSQSVQPVLVKNFSLNNVEVQGTAGDTVTVICVGY